MKLHFVHGDYWEELYIDGEPTEAHHDIDMMALLRQILGEKNVTEEWAGNTKADIKRYENGEPFKYPSGYWRHRPKERK